MACLAYQYGRELFPRREGPPAFFVEKREKIEVLLGDDFPRPGIHQFSDGITPARVMEMTARELSPEAAGDPAMILPLRAGEALDVVRDGAQVTEIRRSWMPAAQRLALGIPLHPDRMSASDWEDLPGIGPKLARAIEMDRQQNGDFGSLEDLKRVRGIGPKRLAEWQGFFSVPESRVKPVEK